VREYSDNVDVAAIVIGSQPVENMFPAAGRADFAGRPARDAETWSCVSFVSVCR